MYSNSPLQQPRDAARKHMSRRLHSPPEVPMPSRGNTSDRARPLQERMDAVQGARTPLPLIHAWRVARSPAFRPVVGRKAFHASAGDPSTPETPDQGTQAHHPRKDRPCPFHQASFIVLCSRSDAALHHALQLRSTGRCKTPAVHVTRSPLRRALCAQALCRIQRKACMNHVPSMHARTAPFSERLLPPQGSRAVPSPKTLPASSGPGPGKPTGSSCS